MELYTDVEEARVEALTCAVAVSCVLFSFDSSDEVNVEMYFQPFLDYLLSNDNASLQYKICSLRQACRIKEAAATRYSSRDYARSDGIVVTAQALLARLQSNLC